VKGPEGPGSTFGASGAKKKGGKGLRIASGARGRPIYCGIFRALRRCFASSARVANRAALATISPS